MLIKILNFKRLKFWFNILLIIVNAVEMCSCCLCHNKFEVVPVDFTFVAIDFTAYKTRLKNIGNERFDLIC